MCFGVFQNSVALSNIYAVFFDVLAEELARRDMGYPQITPANYEELVSRMEDYLQEFELHGTDNIVVESAEV